MADDEKVHTGELLPAGLTFNTVNILDDKDDLVPLEGTASERQRAARTKRQELFLLTYAREGTVHRGCEAAGVSRRAVYNWIEADKLFAAKFERAREIATDILEEEARRRALKGVEEPVFYQGQVVGSVQKYSDILIMMLLNGHRPERFKNRQEHTGKDGGPIAVVHVSYDHNMKPDDM